jgi:hypothetical protein
MFIYIAENEIKESYLCGMPLIVSCNAVVLCNQSFAHVLRIWH